MRITITTITCLTLLAGLLIGNSARAQVINGGFETASGAYTTGALGWSDNSIAAAGTGASAQRSTLDPFAGVAELTLEYTNSAAPGGGPAAIAQSDIFNGVSAGAETLSFEAKGAVIGQENNQVQVQWFDSGNSFLGASGFQSFQGGLTGSYSLKSFSLTAPAGTVGALVQFLEAGSAVANDAGTTRIDNVALVPEPTSLALVGLGGLFLMLLRRRRK